MQDPRTDLIHRAIFDKLTGQSSLYTPEDILIAAGISETRIAKLAALITDTAMEIATETLPEDRPQSP